MSNTPETRQVLAAGTMLANGKYRIVRQLGVGGFGITYLAEREVFGNVAIKELFLNSGTIYCSRDDSTKKQVIPNFDTAQFEAFKKRFLSEAKTLYELRDIQGVVKVLDYFEENGTVYYAMEYLQGENLDNYIRNKHPLAEPEARRIITAIAETLASVHRRNVLHRDVKPSNVIIANDGQVSLIDFGIARTFQVENDDTHTTIYSPRYSPPEQKISKARMGAFSDVYALGATAYYVITGKSPQNLDELSQEGYRSPRFFINNIPHTIEEAINRSMVVKADERLQTVDDFLRIFNGPAHQASQINNETTSDATRVDSFAPFSGNAPGTVTQLNTRSDKSDDTKLETARAQYLPGNKTFNLNSLFSKISYKNIGEYRRKIILVFGIALVVFLALMWAIPQSNKINDKSVSTTAPLEKQREKPSPILEDYSKSYITAKMSLTIKKTPEDGFKYLRRAAKTAIITGKSEKMMKEMDIDLLKTDENDLLKLYRINTGMWNAIRGALITKDTLKLPREQN